MKGSGHVFYGLLAQGSMPGRLGLILAFSQCVELEFATFMPQPSVGISDTTHAHGNRVGGGLAHGALNLGHYFGRMAGRAHPAEGGDAPPAIDINLKHTNGIQQRRHLALENPIAVLTIQVACCITAVITRGSGAGYFPIGEFK